MYFRRRTLARSLGKGACSLFLFFAAACEVLAGPAPLDRQPRPAPSGLPGPQIKAPLDAVKVGLISLHQEALGQQLVLADRRLELYLLVEVPSFVPQTIGLKWDEEPTRTIRFDRSRQSALAGGGADLLAAWQGPALPVRLEIRYLPIQGEELRQVIQIPTLDRPSFVLIQPAQLASQATIVHETGAIDIRDRSFRRLLRRLGAFHRARGEFARAAALLERAVNQAEEPTERADGLYQLAGLYLEWDLPERAIPVLEQAASSLTPAYIHPEHWSLQIRAHYQAGRLESATDLFEAKGLSLPGPHQAAAFFFAGQSYLLLQRYHRAVSALSKIPTHSPYYPYARYALALSYLGLGDHFQSQQVLKKLAQSRPEPRPDLKALIEKARVGLGLQWLEQQRFDEALRLLGMVPLESPFSEQALFGMGWAYLKMGEYVKAIVVLEDLIRLKPQSPYRYEARLWIGFCYARLKAYNRAVASYRVALEAADGRIRELSELLDQLARVEDLPDEPVPVPVRTDSRELRKALAEFQGLRSQLDTLGPEGYRASDGVLETTKRVAQALRQNLQVFLEQERSQLEQVSLQAGIGIAKNILLEQQDFGTEALLAN